MLLKYQLTDETSENFLVSVAIAVVESANIVSAVNAVAIILFSIAFPPQTFIFYIIICITKYIQPFKLINKYRKDLIINEHFKKSSYYKVFFHQE